MKAETEKSTETTSEFAAPRWSVLSFNECLASNLTYDAAHRLVAEKSRDAHGLCVVTDEAAARISADNKSDNIELAAPDKFSETL